MVNTDQTEGRGPMKPHAYFTDLDEAKKVNNDPRFFRKFGVMGTQGSSEYNIKKENITLFYTAEEYFNEDKNLMRKNALAKLTPEEKELLGL